MSADFPMPQAHLARHFFRACRRPTAKCLSEQGIWLHDRGICMGAGCPEWPTVLDKIRSSAVGVSIAWAGIWTAALGISLFLNLEASGHPSRQGARQAVAVEQKVLQPFPEQKERQRILFSHIFIWLVGTSFLGARAAGWRPLCKGQRQAVAELERLRALVEQFDDCPDGICIVQDNMIHYANRRLATMAGIPLSEMAARPLTSFLPGEELVGFSREIGRLADTAVSEVRFDSALLHGERSRFEVEVHARSTVFAGKEARFLVLREIGMRKRREKEAEASRAFLQSILDGMAESVMVFDVDHRLLTMNKSARRFYGDDLSVIPRPFCFQLLHGQEGSCSEDGLACPLKQVMAGRRSCLVSHDHRIKDGGVIPVEISASPIFDEKGGITGIIEVGRDIGHRFGRKEEQARTLPSPVIGQ